MWYNDDDIERKQTNYQNSEVMRIFADQYLEPLMEVEAAKKKKKKEKCPCPHGFLGIHHPIHHQDAPGKDPGVEAPGTGEGPGAGDGGGNGGGGEAWDKPKQATAILDEEMNILTQKLASLSQEYGNEKVRYMIERAIAEIESIRYYGETNVI